MTPQIYESLCNGIVLIKKKTHSLVNNLKKILTSYNSNKRRLASVFSLYIYT